MKNLAKVTLIAVLAFTPLVNLAHASFPDVPEDHIYSDAINYVQEEEIVNGFSDGTYRPESTIPRVEFIKIVTKTKYAWVGNRSMTFEEVVKVYTDNDLEHCIFGKEGIAFYSDFEDVQPLYWDRIYIGEDKSGGNEFSIYTCVAKGLGVIQGYSDGTFRPDNPITVGEASKIIANAYGLTNTESGLEGDVFKPFVDVLTERKVIPETVVSISSELKRGEMAEMIYRMKGDSINSTKKAFGEAISLDITRSTYSEVSDPKHDKTSYSEEARVGSIVELVGFQGRTHSFTINEVDGEIEFNVDSLVLIDTNKPFDAAQCKQINTFVSPIGESIKIDTCSKDPSIIWDIKIK